MTILEVSYAPSIVTFGNQAPTTALSNHMERACTTAEKVGKLSKETLIEMILPDAYRDSLNQFLFEPNIDKKRRFIAEKGERYKTNILFKKARRELATFSEASLRAIAASFELPKEDRVRQRDPQFQENVINAIFVQTMLTGYYAQTVT